MALAMCAVCEHVRLAMGAMSIFLYTLGSARSMEGKLERVRLAICAVSIVLCALGGARSMEGKLDHVQRAFGSSGLAVGICGTGIYGGFGMTTLGGDAGVGLLGDGA